MHQYQYRSCVIGMNLEFVIGAHLADRQHFRMDTLCLVFFGLFL